MLWMKFDLVSELVAWHVTKIFPMLSVVKSLERFHLEWFIFPEILFMEQPSEYGLEFF